MRKGTINFEEDGITYIVSSYHDNVQLYLYQCIDTNIGEYTYHEIIISYTCTVK